jgi:hypothetical protein
MSQQIVNTPLEYYQCFQVSAIIPPRCDYKFLSAGVSFNLIPDGTSCLFSPSLNPYVMPAHMDDFVTDLRQGGNTVDVVGSDVFIRSTQKAISATSMSSLFSAVSCGAGFTQLQSIKAYTSNHGQKMYLNLNNGCVYDVPSSSWTEVACNSLSATSPGSTTITNSTMALSGGYVTMASATTFVVPAGRYHSVEFVCLSGEFAINNAFRLSTDSLKGQRSKSYNSTVANNQNMFLPAMTVSAISAGLVQWDGLYPTV